MTGFTDAINTGAKLRMAMRSVAATVAVITARDEDRLLGITATSVASVSLDPPALLVCVNRSAALHGAIRASRCFRIVYLSRAQEDVARTFGGAGPHDRFATGSWAPDAACGPSLAGALAEVTCKLDRAIDHGTHTIFIGGVGSVEVNGGEPLLYRDGCYSALAA